jgi:transposase InsO family protein
MAYSINPNLVKARKETLLSVLVEHMPVCVAARRFGVHRSTVWRWLCKWRELNRGRHERNYNRPHRKYYFNKNDYRWRIETLSSAPKSHPKRIAQWVVDRILAIRAALGRCAVIIQAELAKEQITVSIATIRRIIAKHGLQKTKRRHIRRTLSRPDVNAPGDLVQVDTIHYVNKLAGERRYIFTIVDLYSRMAYAKGFERLLPGNALQAVLLAQQYFGFKIKTIQSDNGPEFSKWFSHQLHGKNIIHRRTRIHRPNDNAHIERFNRTLREECIGQHMSGSLRLPLINRKLQTFIDYYNNERLHLGIQCRTPKSMLQR